MSGDKNTNSEARLEVEENDEENKDESEGYESFLDECLAGGGETLINSSIKHLSCAHRSASCILGIDEAGRGPVLGKFLPKNAYSIHYG